MGIRALIPQAAINYLKHLPLATLALFYYRFPSRRLKVIGVTGTDGKTTTVSLIYHLLKEAGFRVAMVSTVAAKIDEQEIDTGFHVTSPDPWLLQKLLRRMVDQGVQYLVLEVTSHGLDQFRLLGINYEEGVLTNLTHEHLDYHRTFERYREAKLRLLKAAKTAILNKDDASYTFLAKALEKNGVRFKSYALSGEADFTPQNFPFKTTLPGEYNRSNCLAAIAAGRVLGLDGDIIRRAVASFAGVPGRAEAIKEGQSFKVYVDFAHTPNALEQILKTLKKDLTGRGRLIVVFGAAGLRDREKRPMMGEIAGRLANKVILTAEDPRTEKIETICQQIAEGCQKVSSPYTIVPDRGEAINFAVKEAKKGDIVVVCGKGHEKSMCFGTIEQPWSDQEVVKKALKNIIKRKEALLSLKASEGKA